MSNKSKTAFIFSERYLKHRPSPTHPESPHRLEWIVSHLRKIRVWKQLLVQEPEPADIKWLEQIHKPEYFSRVREYCKAGHSIIDSPDVEVSSESYDIAMLAVGGVLKAMDRVVSRQVKNAFS